jgi:hypothetical protein
MAKTVTVIRKLEVKIEIPTSAEEWQLFRDMRGAEAAAARISAATHRALREPTRRAAERIIAAALNKDSRFGAADTEPRVVAAYILDEAYGR